MLEKVPKLLKQVGYCQYFLILRDDPFLELVIENTERVL